MSNNLDIDQVAAAQNQKEVTINDGNGQIDAAITDTQTLTIDNTNARTLTNDEFRRFQFTQLDPDGGTPPTAAITLTVPAVARGTFTVLNDTGFAVTVTITAQSETAPIIPNGGRQLLSCDGSDVRVGATATTSFPLLADSDGTAANTIYSWLANTGLGVYRIGADILGFATNATESLRIRANGVLSVQGTTNYETLVTTDDDVPNKKYVDDLTASPIRPNLIGNPSFSVQSMGDITGVANNTYMFNRWKWYKTNGSVIDSSQQNTTAIAQDTGGKAPRTYGRVNVTTADATVDAGDSAYWSTGIIVANIERYYDQQVTVSFWVRSNFVGTFCVAVRNPAETHTYVTELVINVANTWERKTFTFTLDTTQGSWTFTNLREKAIRLFVVNNAGATFNTGTNNTWNASGTVLATANQANWSGAISRTFDLTAVKLVDGAVDTSYVDPDFAEELNDSKFYWDHSYSYGITPGDVGTDIPASVQYRTFIAAAIIFEQTVFSRLMRATPSVTFYSPDTGAANNVRNSTTVADIASIGSTGSAKRINTVSLGAAPAINNIIRWHYVVDADIA